MATQITNYQCPACTGPLHYSGETGKLECDYCGSSYSVEEIEKLYGKKEEESVQAELAAAAQQAKDEENAAEYAEYTMSGSGWGKDAANLRSYNCPSCGAELICDATTAATSCPYCGNPSIVPGQFKDTLKPDMIIPFKLDKDSAVKALKNYYKGKRLLPKAFSDQNHIEEIKGVYVPFWLFDGEAVADASYTATRVNSFTRGDERVTITEHFQVRRAGTIGFENIPVDASTKMPDAHMDAIEPYDYRELKPFSTAYLPGYMADKYDVSAEECARHADERAANTAEMKLSETVAGYATAVPVHKDIHIRRGKAKYVLMPVWMLSTKWNGQNFLFAMNGQTGKLIGDLPVSKGRLLAMFAAIAVPLTAVLSLLF